jgi:hypothetical protein
MCANRETISVVGKKRLAVQLASSTERFFNTQKRSIKLLHDRFFSKHKNTIGIVITFFRKPMMHARAICVLLV